MVEWRRFVYASQTVTVKLSDKQADRLFDGPAMADRSFRSQQFTKVQSRVLLHSDLYKHSV